ncbi:MAG TPA: YCF48-related protein [Pyrinomonadaceae bacterium]|nr:YCF48-related protein [Pyrinomonadaceae bacterium]
MSRQFEKFSIQGVTPGTYINDRTSKAHLHVRRQSRTIDLRRARGKGAITLSLFMLSVCCVLPSAHAAWTRQRISSMAPLHSVFFLDASRGWVVGGRGTVLSTDDGGAHWRALPRPTEDNIRDIHFFDPQQGIIICERNIYELKSNDEPRTYLMKTSDGGDHWQRSSLRGANADALIVKALFNNSGHGWAFGEAGTIYVTSDAGNNWLKLQAPTRSLLLGGAFVDDNNAWLVGAGSTILQTADGGESWQRARLPFGEFRFNGASFIEKRLGWVVGNSGAILRTINGGRSWQAQNSSVASDLFDVKFLNAAEGWAVGAGGVVLQTSDGGIHWTQERAVTDHSLERIFFSDKTHGWAVGFGGTIIAFSPSANYAPQLKH